MSVRKINRQEKREWSSDDIVIAGSKPPERLPQQKSVNETEVADNPNKGDGK